MFNEYFGCEFHGVHYRHLDNKVNHFKNNFNLDSVITTMVKEIPKIKVDKNEISSSAMQAIDQYSVIVLKKESLFKYKQSVEINENLDLSYSTSNKL